MKSIEEVSSFLNVPPRDIVKTMIYTADGNPVAVLVSGDEEVNEIKVKNYLNCDVLEMATEEVIYEVTGAPRGFAGRCRNKSEDHRRLFPLQHEKFCHGGK